MWTRFENWQVSQLGRLSHIDPERAETIMNTLWASNPGLLAELAISAVDQEALSVQACADLLNIAPEEVENRLVAFRRHSVILERAVIHDGCRNAARLAEGQVAVWEVVREYRKLGSVEKLAQSFPAISQGELAAALLYAEENPSEIEKQIREYEDMLARRREQYPFVQ